VVNLTDSPQKNTKKCWIHTVKKCQQPN